MGQVFRVLRPDPRGTRSLYRRCAAGPGERTYDPPTTSQRYCCPHGSFQVGGANSLIKLGLAVEAVDIPWRPLLWAKSGSECYLHQSEKVAWIGYEEAPAAYRTRGGY